jgi:hypothetical protein
MERDELVFDVDEYSNEMDGIVEVEAVGIAQRSAIWDSVLAAY